MGPIYGLIVGIVLLLAWGSANQANQKLAMLLLVSWSACNLAVSWLGFGLAPILMPAIDGAVAIGVAFLGHKYRSYTALVVLALFLAESVAHVDAWTSGRPFGYYYFLSLNVIFALQVLTTGGSSALDLYRRVGRGALGVRHHVSRI